ncbi:N-6 DNA methylase [Streptomyces scabiei]|uniref:site-specific DNA-methyltransferase (adenine-specific) n=1 Tax=Streptomyces scabiei TaxID=1930 RepID=A0A124C574_STRSC|nr:N-6 DNA methylase [Streptomyces scabiei]GAQ66713.1 putative type I restriction enzymeP M protein [Streptomyces scabiei]
MRSRPLTVDSLDFFLMQSADLLRDEVKPSELAHFIGSLLLLKRASDQPGPLLVPDIARWPYVAQHSGSSAGETVNRALDALESHNPGLLADLFRSVDFNALSSERMVVRLLGHFDQVSLSDDQLEFGDEVGRAFDRFLTRTASAAGKGYESFTPRAVCRLMAELVRPGVGHSVADPHAGSGGMLLSAVHQVAEQGGSQATLSLFGQEKNNTAWLTGRLNLLLHGLVEAVMTNSDSLTDPLTDSHRLMRFDRVLTAPPFSTNYKRNEVSHPERMRYGWVPEGGKKADLMFVQHILATLRPEGLGAVVTPHGVLFRGGAEGEIRQGMLEDDRLEAVIGIGANVFYNTGIPACILVLRGTGGRSADRRGRVLFIDAEREVTTGRSKNRIDAQHIAKISDAYLGWKDVPRFSRVVSLEEIREHDYNLNIRRYVDSAPPPEPLLDIGAALTGGIPEREVEAEADRFRAFRIAPADLFDRFRPGYWSFPAEGHTAAAARIPALAAAAEDDLLREVRLWWTDRRPLFEERAEESFPSEARSRLEDSFCHRLLPAKILDRYQLLGVLAAWWSDHEDDFRALAAFGFQAVVHRWRSSPKDAPGHVYRKQHHLRTQEAADLVLDGLGADLLARTEQLVTSERQKLVEAYLRWGERYAVSMVDLERQYQTAAHRLRDRMADLGYF